MKTKALAAILAAFLGSSCFAAESILIRNGQSIVFLGDSITNYGSGSESGYVRMVVSGLKANGIEVKWSNAGVPGNKAHHMLARLDKDVIAKAPDWMTLSCGVNDIWFMNKDSTLDMFKKQVPEIVERAQKAKIKVMLLTPTTAFTEGVNKDVEAYAEFLRQYAKEHDIPLADTNKAVRELISTSKVVLDELGRKATVDGVHMAPPGDRAMARAVLRAFGLDDARMAKAEAAWKVIPQSCTLRAKVAVPYATYVALERMADERGMTIEALYSELLDRGLTKVMSAPAAQERQSQRSSR